jgi:hypothetical protein
LAVSLPVLLVCALFTWETVESEQARYRVETSEITARVTSEVERFLAARVVMLQALATSPALDASPAIAEQDLLLGADMSSPAMTKTEMSQDDVEALISKADGKPIDLHDKALSDLDLSGLNLRGANVRTARLNKANLRRADLSRSMPIGDFKGVSLRRTYPRPQTVSSDAQSF